MAALRFVVFRYGGQFDLGRLGVLWDVPGWDGMCCVVWRRRVDVARRLRCVVTFRSTSQSTQLFNQYRPFVACRSDRPIIIFAPLVDVYFVLPLSLQPVFRLVASERAVDAGYGSTRPDSTQVL